MAHTLVSGRSLVSMLETIYDVEPDLATWGRAVAARLGHVLPSAKMHGVVAVAHAEDTGEVTELMSVSNAGPEVDELNRVWFRRVMDSADAQQVFRLAFYPGDSLCSWQSVERQLSDEQRRLWRMMRGHLPGNDGLGLFAYPEPGLVFLAWGIIEGQVQLHQAERRVLNRLVGHLDAGFRLRTRPDLAVAAIAAPDGALLDIEDKNAKPVRSTLAARIAAIERARLRDRRRELDALEDWQALVAGRYSVVPREDADGKRYYLLISNAPFAEEHARLAQREIDVLRLAARGFTNKAIAYALGVSPATSSSALASAALKLGLGSRHDLVAVARAISGPAGSSAVEGGDTALTTAEREVLALLRKGMSNGAIARLRRRSVHTVANQVSTILAKLAAPSRRTLVAR